MLRGQIETRKCYMDWLNNYSMLSQNRKIAMLWLMGLVRAACVSSWLRGPSICSGTAGSTSLDQVDRARFTVSTVCICTESEKKVWHTGMVARTPSLL